MHTRLIKLLGGSLLCGSLSVWAGAGHDHGDDQDTTPPATQAAQPRLALSSSQFELVIVQQTDGLQLYLDDFASNTPIPDAQIELELNGETLSVETQKTGDYYAHLHQPLKTGEHSLMATVISSSATDLLIGDWDIHLPEATPSLTPVEQTSTTQLGQLLPVWIGIGSGLSIVLLSSFWRDYRKEQAVS
jgi:hypothetical protein